MLLSIVFIITNDSPQPEKLELIINYTSPEI